MTMLFGPDKLPYEAALAAEWAKQPGLPGSRENSRRKPTRSVAQSRAAEYDRRPNKDSTTKEGITKMAKTESAPDYTVYADKPITPAMVAFHEWLEKEVGIELDERSVYLAGSLRFQFQADPWSKERTQQIRDERAAEAAKNKAASKGEEDEGEASAKAPAKATGRKPAGAKVTSTSSTSKTGTTATRGRAAAGTKATAGAAPARGRGRAGAGNKAPF